MLTIFTTAKPFRGHFEIIQRNALQSWKRLHPDVEIILFGEEGGSAQVCAELGLRHAPNVERNEFGAIRVDDLFRKAEELARHDILCYVNCDIILMSDFRKAIERVKSARKQFLMVGERWDTNIVDPIDFSRPDWQESVRAAAEQANGQKGVGCIDYFAFSRGLYGSGIPPFGLGRLCWDQWLVWKGVDSGKSVINATPVIMAVHQNHDYSHHPNGWQGVFEGEEPRRNIELAGGDGHRRVIGDATLRLEPTKLTINWERYLWLLRRSKSGTFFLGKIFFPTWFFLLTITRPARALLGLRAANLKARRSGH